nr:LysM peptidoglycan-binding domain-containing protein [Chromobacterium sp. ASV5]
MCIRDRAGAATPAPQPAASEPALLTASAAPAVSASAAVPVGADNSPPPASLAADLSRYTIVSGDTLYSIARRYNLSVDDLKNLNQLGSNTVQVGQQLLVKGSPTLLAENRASAPAAADEALVQVSRVSAPSRQATEYVVKRGDTLYSIARRFGVDHSDIQRWNDARRLARLQPGQRVIVQKL